MSSIRGLEVFEVRDDRIVAVWLTWDWSEAYASLGATFRPADAAGEGRAPTSRSSRGRP